MLRWNQPEQLEQAWRAGLLGPGTIFELVDDDVLGQILPVFGQRPRSVAEVLTRAAASHGDRDFLIGPERTLTFAEAPEAAARMAATLAAVHGVKRGDRVALAGGFSVEHSLAVWGIAAAGAVAVTMNPRWTASELAHAFELTEPVLALVDPDVVDRLPAGTPVRTFDRAVAESNSWRTPDGFARPVVVDEDDPFAIVFTSGTTGRPKGATLSHRNVVHFSLAAAATSAVHSIVHELPASSGGAPRVIGSAPLFHVSGLLGQLTNGAFWGMTLVLAPPGRWDETVHLELTERHRVTSWSIVPTQLWRLIDHPQLDQFDLSSLEVVGGGGASFAPELLRRTAERLPHAATALRVGYGMTETAGTVSMLQPPVPAGQGSSVGTAVAGTEIEIRDAEGAPVADGEVGQIWARGAQVFLGYWGDPDATAGALDDGRWYASGDFGRIVDGYLHLESRLRDLIIRGGENIYPIEIENRLVEHPAIAEAAVIGAPHATLGQEVKAVVVLREGSTATEDDVRRWVAAEHAGFKVPTIVEFRTELPRNDTGKVLKSLLE
ncbi:MAG: class I adenylate-forming enzyme family protein [Acidimicrobiales bacterium]